MCCADQLIDPESCDNTVEQLKQTCLCSTLRWSSQTWRTGDVCDCRTGVIQEGLELQTRSRCRGLTMGVLRDLHWCVFALCAMISLFTRAQAAVIRNPSGKMFLSRGHTYTFYYNSFKSVLLMSVASWCSTCFCVVLCVDFCTGHFVMVPLNLTYLHCLQHSFFAHLFNLYKDRTFEHKTRKFSYRPNACSQTNAN